MGINYMKKKKSTRCATNLESSLLAQDIIGLEHDRCNPDGDEEACTKQLTQTKTERRFHGFSALRWVLTFQR
jgi:hypothetical protein